MSRLSRDPDGPPITARGRTGGGVRYRIQPDGPLTHYVEQMLGGEPVAMPSLVEGATGRYRPLDVPDRAKALAAARCGYSALEAYVIEDPGPEKLEALRRELRAGRAERT